MWGYSDGDLVPRRVFILADRIGGQVIGAFDGDVLVGFAMSLPGLRDGRPYLHSHMLAVLPEYRNAGLGRRLKLAQRDDALARGIDLMEWTFDPLEIKNAHLNIARLGAIAGGTSGIFTGRQPRRYRAVWRPTGWSRSGGCGRHGCAGYWVRWSTEVRRMGRIPHRFWCKCQSQPQLWTGNGIRTSVSWLSLSRLASGSRSNQRLHAGWFLPATNAAWREMVSFFSDGRAGLDKHDGSTGEPSG